MRRMRAWLRSRPDLEVASFELDGSAARLHAPMAARGPFDLLLVALGPEAGTAAAARVFTEAFYQLRAGGVLLLVDFSLDAVGGTSSRGLHGLLAAVDGVRHGEAPDATGVAAADLRALADSITAIDGVGRHLAVTSGVTALAKLDEDQADEVLARRAGHGGRDRVLNTLPAVRFSSRCRLRHSADERAANMPEVYEAPAARLREYHDVLCLPGQVVASGNLLLPDTFRHNQRVRLKNRYAEELGRRFAALPDVPVPATALSGSYFHLDNEVRGHFGHTMTEQLSKLWAWPLAKARHPDLKALLAINKGRELAGFERALFGAAGIAEEDLVFVREPVQVPRLLAATPLLSMPQYVHPEIAHTWQQIGDRLLEAEPAAGERDYPERIFCGRRLRKRRCHNAEEVEALFATYGFVVVHPEDHSLAEQVAIFRAAGVVAGFAGSALFNLCYSATPTRVLLIHSEAYAARNEYMIASVLGHDIDLVTCVPDRPQQPGSWSMKSMQSPYTFDFDREGRFLRKVLDEL